MNRITNVYLLLLFTAQMSQTQALEFTPTPDFPALQYLDRVDKGSMADRAGLKPGDFLLEVSLCPQQMYI